LRYDSNAFTVCPIEQVVGPMKHFTNLPPPEDDDDEQLYWESADEYDPEPEEMTEEDWAEWHSIVRMLP
jgi:hypothetical protein